MPRTARIKSQNQTYHVMLRGINKQQLFYDDEDFRYFTKLLDRFKEPCGYSLYAYCLMGNHVHLLIREKEEASLGNAFKHIECAFVYWYNVKYERTGHLFQDRYRSEPVDDEGYLLTVFRYILMNPVKAGLCRRAEDYPYSSAGEYLRNKKGISDTELIRNLPVAEHLESFITRDNDDQCMEMEETIRKRCTDESARQLILRELGSQTPAIGKAKERQAMNASIRKLIDEGVSIRQLSRLTGISKKVIEDAMK